MKKENFITQILQPVIKLNTISELD